MVAVLHVQKTPTTLFHRLREIANDASRAAAHRSAMNVYHQEKP
jgi:hypothetical protein